MSQLTSGQVISDALNYYVNVGGDAAAKTALRNQALFYLQEVATLGKRYAPWPFKIGSGTVTLSSANYGTLPADFYHMGEYGTVFISGQQGAMLTEVTPQQMILLRRNSSNANTTMPTNYAVYGLDSTGTPLIQVYPNATCTLLVDNYVTKAPVMVDRPAALTAANANVTGAVTGTYNYKVAFTTAAGTTEGGVTSNSIALSSSSMSLTNIPVSVVNEVTARQIYRNKAGDLTTFYLLTTISDNTTTIYTDNTIDSALGAVMPSISVAVTGMETFPPDFSERFFVRGISDGFARNRGDVRDTVWYAELEKEIRAYWGEMQALRNEPVALPVFGNRGVGGGRPLRNWFTY